MNLEGIKSLSRGKKRRRINSNLNHNAKEIRIKAKTADIKTQLQSLTFPHSSRNNESESLIDYRQNTASPNFSDFESSSENSDDYVLESALNVPTISDSSDDYENYAPESFTPTISDSSDEAYSNENFSDIFSNSENDLSDSSFDSDGSSYSYPEHTENTQNIGDFLREWFHSVKFLPKSALTSLLKGLQHWFPSLPKDARTLLGTPRNVEICNMGKGLYHNFGILENLSAKLETMSLESVNTLHLNVNIDGLPLHRSTNDQFWPILAILEEDLEKKPFPISIFHGKTKPPVHEFLAPFVTEFNDLAKDGVKFKGKTYDIKIRCFICDAPAKAYVKCIKGHTGFYGCDKCIQKGARINRVQTFPETNACLRTNMSFRTEENPGHHKDKTPLLDLDIDIISAFPHDYMHLVCLGVMRRLLNSWVGKTKSRKGRMASCDIIALSTNLVNIHKHWPSEFNRKPRSLIELDFWKATEFRQFLFYLGPVYLKSVLSKDMYRHFLLLSCSIAIFTSPDLYLTLNDTAQTCLTKFVKTAPKHYGSEILTYNMHSLLHLQEDVKNLGPLDTFCAFPFENYLQELKRMLSKPNQPLQQVCKRTFERKHITSKCHKKPKMFRKKFIKDTSKGTTNYSQITCPSYKLTDKAKDSCVLLNNNKIVIASSFVKEEGVPYIIGLQFIVIQDFFSKPFKSSILSIFKVKSLSNKKRKYKVSDIKCKMVLLPYKSDFVALPLRHLV